MISEVKLYVHRHFINKNKNLDIYIFLICKLQFKLILNKEKWRMIFTIFQWFIPIYCYWFVYYTRYMYKSRMYIYVCVHSQKISSSILQKNLLHHRVAYWFFRHVSKGIFYIISANSTQIAPRQRRHRRPSSNKNSFLPSVKKEGRFPNNIENILVHRYNTNKVIVF